MTAWMSMYNATHAQQERRPFSTATLRHISGFARPHRMRLGCYLLLSVATAALAVATPVLAGRIVDAIVHGAASDVVVALASLIAGIAMAEAGLELVNRWLSASIGEDLILDLRTMVFDHVQRMPIAFFTRTRTGALSLASLEEVAKLDERGGVEVLHDVSFRAEPGQMVALVGSSGAGKSTIAQLVPRLYDVEGGAVRLSGVDVRDLSAELIRETLGMVPQDGHLFHESVRANLLLVRPEAAEDELWEVLRRARLAELVAALPDGLDTVVGERGYRLSGGERQRLTIARLLLARPRVVILDEATAHLDSTSEAAVQAALGEALAGRTAVVIAHRLSTVRAADLILVIEEGRIVERGTHTDLVSAGGRYRELYRTQFDQPPAMAAVR
ncbi:MAG: ATP-binding cassette domain-containing protein [Pseudonocardiales bacterium]|nr:ATP-binding cassette domain-containing protein [Pseudonocardiales bacterium]